MIPRRDGRNTGNGGGSWHDVTDHEMIALQAKELVVLRNRISSARTAFKDMRSKLTCIGGPLNDNRLEFNVPQLKFLQDIYNTILFAEDTLIPEE